MNRLGRLVLLMMMAGLLVLSGCAKKQIFKQESVPADKAAVYVYFSGISKLPVIVNVNGEELAQLKKGTYCVYLEEPGVKEFKIVFLGSAVRVLDTQPGESYYLKVGRSKSYLSEPWVELVSPETGEREIAGSILVKK